jgi:hypothetical protein
MKKEHNTNFNGMSIILATLGQVDELGIPVPLFPEPPHVKASDIWPDYMIDWIRKEEENGRNKNRQNSKIR